MILLLRRSASGMDTSMRMDSTLLIHTRMEPRRPGWDSVTTMRASSRQRMCMAVEDTGMSSVEAIS